MRPDDFDTYWQRVMNELSALPMAAEETILPIRSTEFSTCYGVRFTSIGPYRLFGYLSVPHGTGPFPTLLILPNYMSVLSPLNQGDASEKRSRYLIFAASGRGQRNSDQPYAADFPGWLMEGLDSPEQFVFRGVVADCCRAVDYLLTRPEVDRSRFAAMSGNELSLITAALRPNFTHATASPSLFYQMKEQSGENGYRMEEVNDYLRLFPDKASAVERTLSYFDPRHFAPAVKTRTLLWGNADFLAPLTQVLGGEKETRESERSTFKDGMFQERWLATQFGFSDVIVPAHWQ